MKCLPLIARSRAWVILTVFVGLLPQGSHAQAPSADRLVRDRDATYFHTPLGLCEDYPEETTTSRIIEGDLDLLNRTGIDLLRISFGWDGIEGAEDQYDWLFWDEFVSSAVDDHGITLIPYICYTPLWNSTTDDVDNSWHYPPKDYEEFGEFVFDLVSRYKDRIKTWEIWNEPDIWIFWAGNQEEFMRIIKAGSEAVRRADPDAKVVLGGLAHDTKWLESLFRDHGVSPYVDVVNIHTYYETWAGRPLEDISNYVGEVARIVDTYGDGQPIWMAEVGYSTFRDSSYVSDGYSAYYAYEHTPEYQAVDLIRRITTALSTQRLSALAWYEIKDLRSGEETIGDFGNNGNLGVAHPDYTPKPAEHALKFINGLFSEPMRALDDVASVERMDGSDAQIHVFEQADGDAIVVAWLATFVPEKRGVVGAGDHKDERHETVALTIPLELAGKATRYDPSGAETAFETIEHLEGGTRLKLELHGGTVAIVQIKRK